MAQPFDANTAGNAEEIEMQFAVKTVEHLEAYENLIQSIPPSKLKLTPIDDELLEHFYSIFPEYKFDAAIAHLDEDAMKTAQGKERWRSFIMPRCSFLELGPVDDHQYEKRVADYNFGTLVRKDADRCYAEDNTILVTRVQFFAIEIARNRNGLNDKVYNDAQAAKKKAAGA